MPHHSQIVDVLCLVRVKGTLCAHLCLFLCVGACICVKSSTCVHLCLCVYICWKFWPQLKQVWTKSHHSIFLMSLWSTAGSDWSGILCSPGPTPSNNSHLSSWLSAQQAQGMEEERKDEFGWINFQQKNSTKNYSNICF